jgi:hypothetical protein
MAACNAVSSKAKGIFVVISERRLLALLSSAQANTAIRFKLAWSIIATPEN